MLCSSVEYFSLHQKLGQLVDIGEIHGKLARARTFKLLASKPDTFTDFQAFLHALALTTAVLAQIDMKHNDIRDKINSRTTKTVKFHLSGGEAKGKAVVVGISTEVKVIGEGDGSQVGCGSRHAGSGIPSPLNYSHFARSRSSTVVITGGLFLKHLIPQQRVLDPQQGQSINIITPSPTQRKNKHLYKAATIEDSVWYRKLSCVFCVTRRHVYPTYPTPRRLK
ncbi:hypothetical protein PoB_003740800 [Plakobranchus ocellatus]|uniref:Uncharacterized protein n=1 Tax=Plakobranchus ocellatus TaxID=259542 RepID=A0AAV4AWK9_9GAST|nr:hypothetical protein PoB_003740800 [Plakobranchus ocellatus]